jgi:hypothetical protein
MDFNTRVFFTLHKGRIVKSKIELDQIIAFGIKHRKVVNDDGTFSKFIREGYIKTPFKTYTVNKYDVNELMTFFKGKYQLKSKRNKSAIKGNNKVSVINWNYTVNMS